MTWEKEAKDIKKREELSLKHGGEESVKIHHERIYTSKFSSWVWKDQ